MTYPPPGSPHRARTGSKTGLIVGIVISVIIMGCVGIGVLLVPFINRAKDFMIVMMQIDADYTLLEEGKPIPDEPAFKKDAPVYRVGNACREMIRDLQTASIEYADAGENVDVNEVYDFSTYESSEEYRRVLNIIRGYHEPDEEYFKSYYDIIAEHKKKLQSSAGNSEEAKIIVELQFEFIDGIREPWKEQLLVVEEEGRLYVERLQLLWKHRTHLKRNEDGEAELTDSAGQSAVRELEQIDGALDDSWERYHELERERQSVELEFE